MNPKCLTVMGLVVSLVAAGQPTLRAADATPPVLTNFHASPVQQGFQFEPYPAAQAYTVLSATNPAAPFGVEANFFQAPYNVTNIFTNVYNGTNVLGTNVQTFYEWRRTNGAPPVNFYRVQVNPMSSNALLASTVLNRLAYGPTPDDLAWVNANTPQAYINQQLAPELITETATSAHTNFPIIQARLAPVTNFVWQTNAGIGDLRAWHILRGVSAKRQLLETLLQFLENHFVTQYSKSYSYLQRYYTESKKLEALAAQFEYLENDRWRNALLNPQCTFYDLLKISAESPAMLIYLDTVLSRGDGKNVANENYARELLELFTFGVDNGYSQSDITIQSRAWTGWRLVQVDLTNAFNPFAAQTTNIIPGSTNASTTTISNLYGAWAFNYTNLYHNSSNKYLFYWDYTNAVPSVPKTVPGRFGPPWAGRAYGLGLSNGSGTNGIQDGYQVLQHVANQPFTEEYISIKLCRQFVHDDFPNPSNEPTNSVYGFYDYTNLPNLSPEAQLVHQCMLAWENSNPKGQIRDVLQTILNSDLFRGHGASMQKVKTPLEYTVSAIRALRSSTNGTGLAGSFTSDTDGYAIGGTSSTSTTPLTRMGSLLLFDRDTPDGYPENGPSWISAGTLVERTRFVQSYAIAAGQAGHTGTTNDAGNCTCDVVKLVKSQLPAASWTNAPAVADYFLGILFPGEGAGNLSLYRSSCINYLNDGSADNPPTTTGFGGLTVSGTAGSTYDTRVRGMVGLLLALQRFQEQ
jgi:uncharacterized protein (DUF1800 family)